MSYVLCFIDNCDSFCTVFNIVSLFGACFNFLVSSHCLVEEVLIVLPGVVRSLLVSKQEAAQRCAICKATVVLPASDDRPVLLILTLTDVSGLRFVCSDSTESTPGL